MQVSTNQENAIPSLLIVWSEPDGGRVDEFNDWYTHVHCHDVMRLDSSVAVQRWKFSEFQLQHHTRFVGPWQRWIAIYEISDTVGNIRDHIDLCFGPEMLISDAISTRNTEDFYFTPADGAKDIAQAFASREGDIIVVGINPSGSRDALVRWYRETYMPATLALDGFISGNLFVATDEQLAMAVPAFAVAAIYHVEDAERAIDAFERHLSEPGSILESPLVETAGVKVAAYSPIMKRFTAAYNDALPAEEKAIEDRVRASLGDKIHASEGTTVPFRRP